MRSPVILDLTIRSTTLTRQSESGALPTAQRFQAHVGKRIPQIPDQSLILRNGRPMCFIRLRGRAQSNLDELSYAQAPLMHHDFVASRQH